jgi:predicted aminopeptidase
VLSSRNRERQERQEQLRTRLHSAQNVLPNKTADRAVTTDHLSSYRVYLKIGINAPHYSVKSKTALFALTCSECVSEIPFRPQLNNTRINRSAGNNAEVSRRKV